MVMTHRSIAKAKKTPIHVKANNPARKFMSKEEAAADNKKLREDREKVAAYAADLKREKAEVVAVPTVVSAPISDAADAPGEKITPYTSPPQDVEDKVNKLMNKMATEKGPGSRARKAKIQAKIDKLLNGT